jgi:hypothetical protein
LTHPFCNELFGPNSGQLFKKFIKAQKIKKINKKHTESYGSKPLLNLTLLPYFGHIRQDYG